MSVSGDLPAVPRTALDGHEDGGRDEEGPRPTADLDGAAGAEEDRGEGGAAERPLPTLDKTAEKRRSESALPRSGEYVERAVCEMRCVCVRDRSDEVVCFRLEA